MSLKTGIVKEVCPKKDGEHTIRLSIGRTRITAQLAILDVGLSSGIFFLPEVGDKVIVGFLNGDSKKPVILGMVQRKSRPALIGSSAGNPITGFTTRSNMQIKFDDDKKSITIDTPAGNKIVLDEDSSSLLIKDQHDNIIKLSASGIGIKSSRDIVIEANGKVEIKAGQALALNGTSVSAIAQASFEAKGATAKMEASGIAEIKASLVKIN